MSVTREIAPRKGLRFYHWRVLDTEKWDGKSPQLYEVTAIRNGCVYYRPVYAAGRPEERLGNPDRCIIEQFSKWAKQVQA